MKKSGRKKDLTLKKNGGIKRLLYQKKGGTINGKDPQAQGKGGGGYRGEAD